MPLDLKEMAPSPAHGGMDWAGLERLGPDAWDFSCNVNPWGCSPRVPQALADLPLSHYPDPDCRALRAVIAAHENVVPNEVLCGNGATELIWALCRSLKPGAEVCFPAPTFAEYQAAAATSLPYVQGGKIWQSIAPDRFAAFLSAHRPALTFVCSPNNPTGQVFSADTVQQFARAASPGLVVVDQAYREYGPPGDELRHSEQLLRLCSLTKAYGLAGLRLGYLVGPAPLLREIAAQIPLWSVSAAAQAAGVAALGDQAWLHQSLARRAEAARLLGRLLAKASFDVQSQGAGFFLVRVGEASAWRAFLLARGLVVRDCASFGLPEFLRFSPGPEVACRRLAAEMTEARKALTGKTLSGSKTPSGSF